MRAALINKQTQKVENIIELPDDYDPQAEGAYLPPENLRVQEDRQAQAIIGGRFDNGVWQAPDPSQTPAPQVDPNDRVAVLEAELKAMKDRVAAITVTTPDSVKLKAAITNT